MKVLYTCYEDFARLPDIKTGILGGGKNVVKRKTWERIILDKFFAGKSAKKPTQTVRNFPKPFYCRYEISRLSDRAWPILRFKPPEESWKLLVRLCS